MTRISRHTQVQSHNGSPVAPTHCPDTFTAMKNLLHDLSEYGPRFNNRPAECPFDVVGGYIPGHTAVEANLVVGTFNTDKLTNYKLNAVTILMI